MSKKTKTITVKVNKSADTGRFVSSSEVKKNPKENYQQTVKKKVGS